MDNNVKLVYDDSPVILESKKRMPWPLRIITIIILSLVGTFTLVWGGLNILKYPIYWRYYSIKRDIIQIPGINNGINPKGITYDDANDIIYSFGYNKNEKKSQIFTIKNKKAIVHDLTINGEPFISDVGAIATNENFTFIAKDKHIYVINNLLLNDKNSKLISIDFKVDIDIQPSFLFANETFLYAGEYCDKTHPKENKYKDNSAVIVKYDINDMMISNTKPDVKSVLSIQDKVQGFLITPSKKIVLSTSSTIESSKIYIYSEDKLADTGKNVFCTPLKYLEKHDSVIVAPPMIKNVDLYKDDRIITFNESASNTYVFGKFFFSNKIVSLDIK